MPGIAHLSLGLASLAAIPLPQSPPIDEARRTVVLQRAAIPGTSLQMGLGRAVFPPNAAKPRHKASGPETCYVLRGEIRLEIAGVPPRLFRAGETFTIPANAVHSTRAGPAGATVIAAWVWSPGEPFNTPAAQ
jgi:quercetin dioxygenase-like cupin family protein